MCGGDITSLQKIWERGKGGWMLTCSHCGCSHWRSFHHCTDVGVVCFKTQDNSTIGAASPGKQDPYLHLSWSYLFGFNLFICIWWMEVWGCFFQLKEPWMSTASPASAGEHFGGGGADGSSSSLPQCKQELERGWVTVSYCFYVGLSNRTEHLLPRLVNLIDLLVSVWDEEWQNVGLVLYWCLFVEFHLRMFKYVCPVQICCPVNVWTVNEVNATGKQGFNSLCCFSTFLKCISNHTLGCEISHRCCVWWLQKLCGFLYLFFWGAPDQIT